MFHFFCQPRGWVDGELDFFSLGSESEAGPRFLTAVKESWIALLSPHPTLYLLF
jgi:hypothetical protein